MKPGRPLQRGKPMSRGTGFKPGAARADGAPRKRSTLKASRPTATAAESRHMGLVAALGCICCSACLGIEDTPAVVHHLRTDQGKKRASHMDTLPLCPYHHQDSGAGVHDMGRAEFATLYGQTEVELLHIVQAQLKVPLWVSPYQASA